MQDMHEYVTKIMLHSKRENEDAAAYPFCINVQLNKGCDSVPHPLTNDFSKCSCFKNLNTPNPEFTCSVYKV